MNQNKTVFPNFPLAELHSHLATSINPAVYWQIAHAQGFKLPKKDFHEFIDYVMLSERKKMTLNEYFDKIYHPLLDPLSSGTFAVDQAVYEIMSGAYRNNITLIELRNNPMKHNREGELDLDHIIMASLRGMERALLEYRKLRAGIILCIGREFSVQKNEIIIEKAIKYHRRGIVGIDVAGPAAKSFKMKDYKDLFAKAKKAGLGTTVHTGEVNDSNDIWEALEFVAPSRIGHGIKAAYDKKLMIELSKRNIVLEICPFSNLVTKAVENVEELEFIIRTFLENKVKFCINTDWPEVIEDAHLYRQFQFLLEKKIMTKEELENSSKIAFESTFIPPGGFDAYL